MLSTCIRTIPIDIDLEHHGKVIFTVASEIKDGLTQFMAFDTT